LCFALDTVFAIAIINPVARTGRVRGAIRLGIGPNRDSPGSEPCPDTLAGTDCPGTLHAL